MFTYPVTHFATVEEAGGGNLPWTDDFTGTDGDDLSDRTGWSLKSGGTAADAEVSSNQLRAKVNNWSSIYYRDIDNVREITWSFSQKFWSSQAMPFFIGISDSAFTNLFLINAYSKRASLYETTDGTEPNVSSDRVTLDGGNVNFSASDSLTGTFTVSIASGGVVTVTDPSSGSDTYTITSGLWAALNGDCVAVVVPRTPNFNIDDLAFSAT